MAIGREGLACANPPATPAPADCAPAAPGQAPPSVPPQPAPSGPPDPPRPPSSARLRWAQLLARIYEVLPLLCPACGGELRVIAFLTDPPVVQGILLHLDLPHRPPPIAPARGPPQAELDLDQTTGFDLTAPEPAPDFDFDQSLPEGLDD